MAYFSKSISPLIYPLIIIFIYLTILVTVAEVLNRSVADDPELTRKVVHIGSGNVILLAWWLDIKAEVIISAAVIAAIIALISYVTPILPSINSVGRKSLGTLFYAVSIGILTQLFWRVRPEYTAIGILVMAWGDGMAAIVGQRFGKHKYRVWGIEKSWEGSAAMAIATMTVTFTILLFSQGNSLQSWSTAIIVAVSATALEAFSKLGIDNLSVPLISGAICYICERLNQYLHI